MPEVDAASEDEEVEFAVDERKCVRSVRKLPLYRLKDPISTPLSKDIAKTSANIAYKEHLQRLAEMRWPGDDAWKARAVKVAEAIKFLKIGEGTQVKYFQRWNRFAKWCQTMDIDPDKIQGWMTACYIEHLVVDKRGEGGEGEAEGANINAASLAMYVSSLNSVWSRRNVTFGDAKRRVNPWESVEATQMKRYLKSRIEANDEAYIENNERSPLPPGHVKLLVDATKELLSRGHEAFATESPTGDFTFSDMKYLRDCLMIRYQFQFSIRAVNLMQVTKYWLRMKFSDCDGGWHQLGYCPGATKTSKGGKRDRRMLPYCDMTDELACDIHDYLELRRRFACARVNADIAEAARCRKDVVQDSVFQVDDLVTPTVTSTEQLTIVYTRLDHDNLKPEIFKLPGEPWAPTKEAHAFVTARLRKVLDFVGAARPPAGFMYASHSVRGGGSSSYYAAMLSPSLAAVEAYMNWRPQDGRAGSFETSYLAKDWSANKHPDVVYFFGWYPGGVHDVVAADLRQKQQRAEAERKQNLLLEMQRKSAIQLGEFRTNKKKKKNSVDSESESSESESESSESSESESESAPPKKRNRASGPPKKKRKPSKGFWYTTKNGKRYVDKRGNKLSGTRAWKAYEKEKR